MPSINAINKTQPKSQVACDKEVKTLSRLYMHKKCTCPKRRIYASKVTGKKLNDWVYGCMLAKGEEVLYQDETKRFNPRKHYMVCNNLKLLLDKQAKKGQVSPPSVPLSLPIDVPKFIPTLPRLERNQNYNEARDNAMNEEYIEEDSTPEDTEEEEEEGCEENENGRGVRIGKNEKFKKLVLDGSKKYRKPFGMCKMRTRRDRMNEVLRLALSICIDSKQFNTNELNSYLDSNKLLCVDVVNLLDGVKEILLKKCKVANEDVDDEATPPPVDDEEGYVQELNESNP